MKKLHLGCGKRYIPGFIHIDTLKYKHIDFQSDISKLDMINNESINLIYACHVLEHFGRKEVLSVLREWNRVIIKGGVLRVSVPGFKECLKIYQKFNDINLIMGPIIGGQRDKYDFHKMIFDFEKISELLKEAGFTSIKKYDWKKTEHAEFDDYSQAYIPHMDKRNGLPISLNIEAIK